jgi:tRNA dimethylallyltransferase
MVQSIVLSGPTASGKSSLSVEVASSLGLEIINADSVCFYRGFDIGSAKPTAEERAQVPHHLIDVADPLETYHAGRFLKDCKERLAEIHSRGKRALIVGGSGFYLKALRKGLWDAPEGSPEFRNSLADRPTEDLFGELLKEDPVQAQKIGPTDRYRLVRALEIFHLSGRRPSELESGMGDKTDPSFQLWVIDRENPELMERIRIRVDRMLEQGWMEETRHLMEAFPESRTLRAVGYAQVVRHLKGEPPPGRKILPGIAGLREEIILSHRQLVKQQRTWFKQLSPDRSFTLDSELAHLKEKLIQFYQ